MRPAALSSICLGSRRPSGADFRLFSASAHSCIHGGAAGQKEVSTIPISRGIFASSSKVGASPLAHSLLCLPSPFFTRPSSIGARGREGRRGRKDEEARRRKERNRRSHFPPFLPRTALRAVKRRWKTGQGARAATNERSPAGEKRVRKPPNEGGYAREGGRGREGRKRSRGIDSSSNGGEREMRRGEERWLVVVGLFPLRHSSEWRSVFCDPSAFYTASCHYSCARTHQPNHRSARIFVRAVTDRPTDQRAKTAAAMGRSRSTPLPPPRTPREATKK